MANKFGSVILTLTAQHSIKARFGFFQLCTSQATRKYCTNNNFRNEKVDKKCTNLLKNNDSSLADTISNILSINTNEALQICNRFNEIKRLSKENIINIITAAKQAGVSISSLQNDFPIFVQNRELLSQKFYYIKMLNDNINEVLPLLNIDLKYLKILAVDKEELKCSNGINKIRYLANELEVSVYKLCLLVVKEPSILVLSFSRIKIVIKLLKEYNFEMADIINNLWLFKYSPQTIHRRATTVKSAGVNVVKPWVIRISVNGLQRYINTLRKGALLNSVYGSHIGLLSKKLNIPEEEVKFYIKRCPLILDIQLDKVNEVLDILLKYGYHAEDILSCQRVFSIRTSLLRERLERLQKIRGKHRLTLIYCSKKLFEQAYAMANKVYNKSNICDQ